MTAGPPAAPESRGSRCKVLFDGKEEAEMVATEELLKVQMLCQVIKKYLSEFLDSVEIYKLPTIHMPC